MKWLTQGHVIFSNKMTRKNFSKKKWQWQSVVKKKKKRLLKKVKKKNSTHWKDFSLSDVFQCYIEWDGVPTVHFHGIPTCWDTTH